MHVSYAFEFHIRGFTYSYMRFKECYNKLLLHEYNLADSYIYVVHLSHKNMYNVSQYTSW